MSGEEASDSDFQSVSSYASVSSHTRTVKRKKILEYKQKGKTAKSSVKKSSAKKSRVKSKGLSSTQIPAKNMEDSQSGSPIFSSLPNLHCSSTPKVLIGISEKQKQSDENLNALESILVKATSRPLEPEEFSTTKAILGNLREQQMRTESFLESSTQVQESPQEDQNSQLKLLKEELTNSFRSQLQSLKADILASVKATLQQVLEVHVAVGEKVLDKVQTEETKLDTIKEVVDNIKQSTIIETDTLFNIQQNLVPLKEDIKEIKKSMSERQGNAGSTPNELILSRKEDRLTEDEVLLSLQEASAGKVQEARFLPSGKLKVICSDSALASLTNNPTLQNTLELSEVGPERIKMIIYNLDDRLEEEKILRDLAQDVEGSIEHYKIVKTLKHAKLNLVHKVIMVPKHHAKALLERSRVSIDCKWHPVKRFIPLLRCFNCQMLGHTENRCTFNTICGKCTLKHRTSECTSESEYCYNCHDYNSQKIRTQPSLNIYHKTSSRICPYLTESIKRMQFFRSSTDFITPVYRKRNLLLDLIHPNPFYYDPDNEEKNAPIHDTDKIIKEYNLVKSQQSNSTRNQNETTKDSSASLRPSTRQPFPSSTAQPQTQSPSSSGFTQSSSAKKTGYNSKYYTSSSNRNTQAYDVPKTTNNGDPRENGGERRRVTYKGNYVALEREKYI